MAEELPPVEYGTDPYNYDYGHLRGDDPYQKPQGFQEPARTPPPPQVNGGYQPYQQQYVQPAPAPYQNQIQNAPQDPAAVPPQAAQDKVSSDSENIDQLLKAKHKFGLIVPLTGKGADVGKALRDAAKMAILEKGSPDYAVIPIDVNGTGGAEAAAELAVTYKVEAILGPVFSDEVGKVAKVARANKLKVFSFSNNKQVAGGGVYILGMIPSQQVERVLLYSANHGVKNYGAIIPNNNYGHSVAEMTTRFAKWIGGDLREIGLYSAKTSTSTAAGVIADSYKKKGAKPSLSKDAIVIPEGGDKLRGIATSLANAGVGCGRVRCLGVASWDNKNIISAPQLNGAWYASSPYEDVEDFISRFKARYNYAPDEIASLGYDAATLAVDLAPYFNKSDVESSSGYKGIKGIYRFTGEGINQRGYAIYEIHNGTAEVLDGAPNRF